MIEKHLFKNKKEWDECCKKFWKNTGYHKYYISPPTSFPCIALETTELIGDLGTLSSIEEYVYPEEFNV